MVLVLHCILSFILAWNISAAIPAFLTPRFQSRTSMILKTAMLYIICLFPIIPDFVQTYLISFAVFIAYIFIFYKDSNEKDLSFSAIFFSIIGSWSYLSSWWIERISMQSFPTGIGALSAVLLVVLAILYFSIFRVYFRQVSDSMLLASFSKRMWNYATIIALAPSVIVLTLVVNPPKNLLLLQALTFFSILIATMLFPLLYQMGRSAKLSEENSRLRAMGAYYQSVEAQQQEIRKLKHDLMNHLTVIATYLDLGENDKAVDYLKELGTRFSELTKQYTQNTLINAILNSKQQKASTQGLAIEIKADVESKLNLDETDLCTLIANSLDNAIEANPPDKKIQLELLQDEDRLLFSVTNRYEKKIRMEADGSFITSKDDSKNHGLGIKNIKEAVERMGGKIEITTNDNIFRLYAEIRLENEA
ncbi:MAG: GHKL domain-containing protein [Spirochaetes bacterium]|uniref:GHKL domain-containing protein n=1 Tax=Candidatus Ornithospirochaeta stercoripullorum TaxID=2840899 RepID=A0A9D9E0N8_9SPIO|nr:GHKL domain-containing protein [Candidatus Ornithospirochaeta stercoripullorum]